MVYFSDILLVSCSATYDFDLFLILFVIYDMKYCLKGGGGGGGEGVDKLVPCFRCASIRNKAPWKPTSPTSSKREFRWRCHVSHSHRLDCSGHS